MLEQSQKKLCRPILTNESPAQNHFPCNRTWYAPRLFKGNFLANTHGIPPQVVVGGCNLDVMLNVNNPNFKVIFRCSC